MLYTIIHLGLLGVKGRNIAVVDCWTSSKRTIPANMIFIMIQNL